MYSTKNQLKKLIRLAFPPSEEKLEKLFESSFKKQLRLAFPPSEEKI
jgi:hypothetical protein